jgi:hypothetical protein
VHKTGGLAVAVVAMMSRQIIGKHLIATRRGVDVRLRYLQDGAVTRPALLALYSGIWDFEIGSLCGGTRRGPRHGRVCVPQTALGGHSFPYYKGVMMSVRT